MKIGFKISDSKYFECLFFKIFPPKFKFDFKSQIVYVDSVCLYVLT